MNGAVLSKDGKNLTVTLAITFRKSGHRKRIVSPAGVPAWSSAPARPNSTLTTAIARAHRWKALMESGKFATLGELAKSEGINFSYVCRILRLALLSPKIIEAILDGRQDASLELRHLIKSLSPLWDEQEAVLLQRVCNRPDSL
jgi:hypothetical protein